MFFRGKYSHISDMETLKRNKPRRAIIPTGNDLKNFLTSDPDLLKLGNFGLEMMKFFPKLEKQVYQGKMVAREGEGRLIEHGVLKNAAGDPILDDAGHEQKIRTWVTDEWYAALNEYDVSLEDASRLLQTDEARLRRLYDADADGRINNAETIKWAEEEGALVVEEDGTERRVTVEDGLGDDRQTWLSGQHHRVGRFGTLESSAGFAGAGMLSAFKNLEANPGATDWNHINNKSGDDLAAAAAVADKPYFTKDVLKALYNTRDADAAWLQLNTDLKAIFGDKSYYEIVMNGDYKSLNSADAVKLSVAMYESRQRAWQCMTEIFGDVTDTRSDEAMMAAVDAFMADQNAYTNHHELSLFPMFLYMQHSFQNQVTMYYERGQDITAEGGRGDGYNNSLLGRDAFYDFVEWMGRENYNEEEEIYTGDAVDRDGDGKVTGKLIEFRDSLSSEDRQRKIDDFIHNWFGATENESAPRWEGYGDYAEYGDYSEEEGDWVSVRGLRDFLCRREGEDDLSRVTPTEAFIPHINSRAYSWDKKWDANDIRIHYAGGGDNIAYVGQFGGRTGWNTLHNMISGESVINMNATAFLHRNYAAAQLDGISSNAVVAGPAFNQNWVVHALGTFTKNGQYMDMLQVMRKSAETRIAGNEFKLEKQEYARRAEEIEDDKIAEQRAQQRRLSLIRKMLRQKNPPPQQKPASNRRASDEHYKGSPEYNKAMQKLRMRLLKGSANRKAWLKKTKEDTK